MTGRPPRLCTLVLALPWLFTEAQAQTEGTQLAPVVVTATRTPVPLSQVLADVTVLTRDDIARTTGRVADVLRGVAGLEITRNGGPGNATSLFLRGAETRFTAVLIDGVRVDSQSTSGGASWESIPLSQIERIEVVRGPASSVYGSDALGGVIQIFTRKGEAGLRLDAGLGGGNKGGRKADVAVSGASGRVDFAVAAATDRSDGFSARSVGNPDHDGYRNDSASARVGFRVSYAHRLEASALRSKLDSQYDSSPSPASRIDDRAKHGLETLRAQWSAKWTPMWDSLVSVSESKDRYETAPNPVSLAVTRIRAAAWQNDLRFGAHTVNATLERREDALAQTSLVGVRERDIDQTGLGLGYGWRERSFAFQVNARHDNFSAYGSVNTGSVSAGVDVADGWRVRSSWGNGFRAPTLYQRFSIYGPTARELGPERSLSNVELALHHRAGAFDSSATVYRNRIADLIVYGAPGACPSTAGCYGNVSNAVLKGVTLASAFSAAGWRVSGSLDIQSPRNDDTDKLLHRRARRHAAASLSRDLGDATLGVQWTASEKRFDTAANTTQLAGYSLLNLDAEYRFTPEWRLQARVDNLADKRYQTANTYNGLPRTAFVGVRWTPTS